MEKEPVSKTELMSNAAFEFADDDRKITYFKNKGASFVVIPAGVTTIGEGAFALAASSQLSSATTLLR